VKLLAESADLAELLSAFVRKGGWLAAPLGGIALLYFLQERLVFNPVRTPAVPQRTRPSHRARAVSLVMGDGAHLRGWWMRPNRSSAEPGPAVLYFGGRSEEVSWVSEQLTGLNGMSSLFVNYRGYGSSEGQPSEHKMLADALELYDWVCSQPGVDRRRLSVVGRSLGTGIATYLSARRAVAATVLITPYDNVVELARLRFPFCGTQLLLKHRFESVRFARAAQTPALVLLAESDEIVPREHAVRLIDAWAGTKQVATIPGTTHCDVQENPLTWKIIRDFLGQELSRTGGDLWSCKASARLTRLAAEAQLSSTSA